MKTYYNYKKYVNLLAPIDHHILDEFFSGSFMITHLERPTHACPFVLIVNLYKLMDIYWSKAISVWYTHSIGGEGIQTVSIIIKYKGPSLTIMN